MTGLAPLMRELDRVIDGAADELNPEGREFLATKLQRAILRCQNPPRRQPENIIPLHRPDPFVGNTPRRTQFKP